MKTNPLVRLFVAALFAFPLLALCVGCGTKLAGDDVAATVDGRKIYRADVEKYYDNQTAGSQQRPVGEQATSLRLSILRELVDNEILMRRAEKLGLLATDDEVERKVNEIKSPYTKEEFDARMKEKKLTLDDFKRDLRRSLTVDKVLNKEVTSKINVSDQDISNYYNAHKAEFNLVEPQYHLAQIFVTVAPNPQVHNLKNDKAQNEADARKKIQMLVNRLDSGDDFGTLAMNFSEQPETAPNGGDMGFVGESQMHVDPVIFNAITKLKAGEVTDILPIIDPQTKKPVGYAIYKLLSRDPPGQRDLNDPRVQQAIRQQLQLGRSQLLKAAYLEMVHNQAKVENFFAEEIFKNDAH